MNYEPHVKRLADGRTEITTKMICEAERKYLEETTVSYPEYYYNQLKLGAINMSPEERERCWQQQMIGMQQSQINNQYSFLGFNSIGNFDSVFGLSPSQPRCPHCGR